MKVLLISTGLGLGGAEHVVVNLADQLVGLGHTVKIAYLLGPALVLPKNNNIEVIAVGMHRHRDMLTAYLKLRSIIKQFNPDVVHSHMVHANLLTRLVRVTTAIPRLLCTAHSNNEGGKLRMLAYRLTDKLADISTNVSEQAVADFIKQGAVKPGRMLNVPNGIDTTQFNFDRVARARVRAQLALDNKKMLLAVGNLHAAKDYPCLLRAIALLAKQRQDFKLFIVGTGPLETALKQQVQDLDISQYVEFLGRRRDIKDLMSACDIYVMSSAWEGLPMVILESMACERLVVATDCGGIKEVISGLGLSVSPQDPLALAQSLEQALLLPKEQVSFIGTRSRERIVNHYSLQSMVSRYIDLYQHKAAFNYGQPFINHR